MSKLAVGNWFSGTHYMKATKISGDDIEMSSKDMDTVVSKDIAEKKMNAAGLFSSEEKLPVTKIGEILLRAGNTCFTVCFNTKIDEKAVKDRLAAATAAELTNAKALSSEILKGKEVTIVGHLASTDGKLGRSLVIDLPTGTFKQVDHRTIKWLIFKDVKYSLK